MVSLLTILKEWMCGLRLYASVCVLKVAHASTYPSLKSDNRYYNRPLVNLSEKYFASRLKAIMILLACVFIY